jgi:hypothetical protein
MPEHRPRKMASPYQCQVAKVLADQMSLEQLEDLASHITARARRLQPCRHPPAAWKTFNTPELLEKILLHLPLHDIFTSMRVSRVFRNTVSGSPSLQRKMFLAQEDKANSQAGLLHIECSLLDSALMGLGFVLLDCRYRKSERTTSCGTTVAAKQAAEEILEICYTNNPSVASRLRNNRDSRRYSESSIPLLVRSDKHQKRHSWRKMYLTAHPIRVQVSFTSGTTVFDEDDFRCVRYGAEPERATLGRLYDMGVGARRALGPKPTSTAVQRFFDLPSGVGAVR